MKYRYYIAPLIVFMLGCSHGPELAPVTGQVSMDGRPLDLAEISFEPAQGRASHALTEKDGRYELRYTRDRMGGLVGSHTVRVKSLTELTGPNGQSIVRPQLVPERYNTKTELHAEVERGKTNVIDFDLKSGKK